MENWYLLLFLILSFILFLFGIRYSSGKKTEEGKLSSWMLSGFFLWQAIDGWCNYVLYPTVLGVFGLIEGTTIMIIATLFLNVAYVFTNNKTETDWTFMSWFTHLRDSDSPDWYERYVKLTPKLMRGVVIYVLFFIRKILRIKIGRWRLSDPIGYIYLSVWQDSFYAINFLYHKKADLRNAKVLTLFLVSHLICNIAWAPIANLIAIGTKYIFHLFF